MGTRRNRLARFPARPIIAVDGQEMWRVGKKAAGAELDGRLWQDLPPILQAPA